MLELGKLQKLVWKRTTDHGAYLGIEGEKEDVLLPKKYLTKGAVQGDELEVFLYKDSEDRLIATTKKPLILLGQIARLRVIQVTGIGAFLDWGLEKDLFLPFKEQTHKLKPDDYCLVTLYIDKSSRLCATMKVYGHLSCAPEGMYAEGDRITGTVYEIKPNLGAFVAVGNLYHGMIPRQEYFKELQPGEVIEARIIKIRKDGKLDLSTRDRSYVQIEADAENILKRISERGGVLPFTDKAAPLIIQREFGLSKNAFKRAVGHLMKDGRIAIGENTIEILPEEKKSNTEE